MKSLVHIYIGTSPNWNRMYEITKLLPSNLIYVVNETVVVQVHRVNCYSFGFIFYYIISRVKQKL